jgi:glutathione S-transferase
MPMEPTAAIEVIAYNWVPPLARGQVRDLRARWALEEIGLPYRTRLFDVRNKPDALYALQPFGQVPAYCEGAVQLFECGAIALHIAEKDERLLPRDPIGRGRATSWLFAALNSIDPLVLSLIVARVHGEAKGWAAGARETIVPMLEARLQRLADALGGKDWLDTRFTVADLMMVATLRAINRDLVAMPEPIAAYVARGEARPAFQAALAAQFADFIPEEQELPA